MDRRSFLADNAASLSVGAAILTAYRDAARAAHMMGCHIEISKDGEDFPYYTTWQPDEAPVEMTVAQLREAFERAETITGPGIYFTSTRFLCNQTRGTTTNDQNPYRYCDAQ